MQIDRLLAMVPILLQQGRVTAGELARRFGVSTRTVYRDVDALSLAGVPVYCTKGNGGGISLLPEYTVDRSFLSQKEQADVLAALEGLRAARYPDLDGTLAKIGGMFRRARAAGWIEVDFSYWGSGAGEREKFPLIKEAILAKRVLAFTYCSARGETTARSFEPVKLLFRGNAWYVWGFCRLRRQARLLRVSRMRGLRLTEEPFAGSVPPELPPEALDAAPVQTIALKLKFAQAAAHRVYDDFNSGAVEYGGDGTFTVAVDYPYDEWVIGYILSFGAQAEVLSPQFVREEVAKRAREIAALYGG